MRLDLSSFIKALNYLQAALQEKTKQDNDYLRDSCIQRFEYTYELSWKMLKRYLELTEPNRESMDILSFAQLIRKGCGKGLLLSDWSTWKKFREARNNTSHTYNDAKANEVFAIVPSFYEEANYLYQQLKQRLNEN